MTDQVASYRRILKSSSIVGGASVINILIGLVRTKVLLAMRGIRYHRSTGAVPSVKTCEITR